MRNYFVKAFFQNAHLRIKVLSKPKSTNNTPTKTYGVIIETQDMMKLKARIKRITKKAGGNRKVQCGGWSCME